MRMVAMTFLSILLLQFGFAYGAAEEQKPSEKWGVEISIDSLKISNPIITKDLVRAIYWHESRWQQCDDHGKAYSCREKDRRYRSWGIAQIYDDPRCRYPGIDYHRIKTDPVYNVRAGLKILEEKFNQVNHIRHKFKISKSKSDIEIGLSLYNGWREKNRWEYAARVLEVMRQKPWEADDGN